MIVAAVAGDFYLLLSIPDVKLLDSAALHAHEVTCVPSFNLEYRPPDRNDGARNCLLELRQHAITRSDVESFRRKLAIDILRCQIRRVRRLEHVDDQPRQRRLESNVF